LVQGVYYRAWTVETATNLGLVGWVRNRHDGTVEAVFQGAVAAVDAMVLACETGPRDAQVTSVVVEIWSAIQNKDFSQRATA
jgi:acylphosphatase